MLEFIFEEAKKNMEEIISVRRQIHNNPEVGFNINKTYELVYNKLIEYGLKPIPCGKKGMFCDIGSKKDKVLLLRADMDALEMKENTKLNFKSVNGNMHSCGHDIHTSILLGVAKILSKNKDKLIGTIRLMFQPAEEILAGALDMINNGVLNNPKVTNAIMIHVSLATNINTGYITLPKSGVIAPGCANFTINAIGKGCHGAMPNLGLDPINALSHILLAIQSLPDKEFSLNDQLIITCGVFNGGNSNNTIPNNAYIKGTLRSYDDECLIFAKKRITEISKYIGKAFNIKVNTKFTSQCPTLINDENLNNKIEKILKPIYKDKLIDINNAKIKSTGSEDFSYISHSVPSLMISISAGGIDEGYKYPLHNQCAVFNEEVLYDGIVMLTHIAFSYFQN